MSVFPQIHNRQKQKPTETNHTKTTMSHFVSNQNPRIGQAVFGQGFVFSRGAEVKQKFQLDEKRKEVNKVQRQITEKKKASKGQDKCWESLYFFFEAGKGGGGEFFFFRMFFFIYLFFWGGSFQKHSFCFDVFFLNHSK